MRKGLLFTLMLLLAPVMAQAQIHQVSSSGNVGNSTIQFNIGYFALKGLESRSNDDVEIEVWVPRGVLMMNSLPSYSYHTGVTCGRPSGRTVESAATFGSRRNSSTSGARTVIRE